LTLHQIDQAPEEALRPPLFECCGCARWVDRFLAARPFHNQTALLTAADSAWWALDPSDWIEAFRAHPRIGEKNLSALSSQEQSGLNSAPHYVLDQLAARNLEYERRFGWIFLICATGQSAQAMLQALTARLDNSPDQELQVAAAEHAKIIRLRLIKLLSA